MAKFTEQAVKILEARYLLKDKDGNVVEKPDEMLDRVAKCISKNEKNAERWEKKFLDIMDSLEFLPNSPTLMNAGRHMGLSACYVLSIEDDLAAIFETVKQSALIHKGGGGTGFSFSKLRPKGTIVNSTRGTASGPVSFMQAFDAVTECVKQGGVRRGANLGSLSVSHPDIIEFINCKKDTSKFTNFNISVGMTGKFLEITKNGKKHWLVNPNNREDRKVTDAGDLFTLICNNMWENGEPGILFLDTINATNPIPWMGSITVTNPCGEVPLLSAESCFSPNTRITTNKGLETVEELFGRQNKGEDILIATDNNWGSNRIIFRRGVVSKLEEKELVKIKLVNGQELIVTPDHKIFTDFGWKEAGNLTNIDKVKIQSKESGDFTYTEKEETKDLWQMLGWFTGDGWFTKTMGLTFGPQDTYAFDKIVPIWYKFTGVKTKINEQRNKVRCVSTENSSVSGKFVELGFTPNKAPRKRVPKSLFTLPKELQIAYLQGLFSADGCVAKNKYRASLSSASLELLKDVQLLLINLGIRSRVSFYEIRKRGSSQGELYIAGKEFLNFVNLIGFALHPEKQQKCVNKIITKGLVTFKEFITVKEITSVGKSIVYDISEPVTHSLIAEGMVVHNCNLGSIDVSKFVNVKGEINWEKLVKTVEIATRFLDNIIDVNVFPNVKIARKTRSTRKIGLGIMGWADMLLMMKIRYDSEEALELATKLMSLINQTAHETSEELGKEKGYFPANNGILKRRNATLTTIAPTGTLSMLADCSSGIEPVFAKKFTKTVLGNVTLDISKKYQKLEGDYFVTALEISPEWHVRMQAAFQKNVDNAVSKTINLPHEATLQNIKKAIYLAHELGCKGLTMYRQGTREAPIQITSEGLSECEGDKCLL